MKFTSSFAVSTLACLLSASGLAQTGEETVVLLPEDAELPDVVTAAIDLPKNEDGEYRPSQQAIENSARGLETANAAREDGRAFGQEMAAAAREDRSRGGRPENMPGEVTLPTLPELPDLGDLRPGSVPDGATLPTLPERPERPELPVTPAPGH